MLPRSGPFNNISPPRALAGVRQYTRQGRDAMATTHFKRLLAVMLASALLMGASASLDAANAEYDVVIRKDVQYVEHDGTRLSGDFYLPKGVTKAPVVIGIHGGGWQNRSRASYQHWG